MVAGAALALPLVAGAAGFSSSALFLSKSPVVEGETILIHAVVQNESAEPFSGELAFETGTTTIGTVPVTLEAGEARTVSISWSPAAGTHTVVALLESTSGEVAADERASFTVAKKPEPKPAGSSSAAAERTDVETSSTIQSAIENTSPTAAKYSAPVLTSLDSLREKGTYVLDGQIAQTRDRLESGEVLGESDEKTWGQTASTIAQTLYLYVLTLMRAILANVALFYPLFAIAFLYALWRLYRRMSGR
jgi:hypothetical protein